MNPAWPDYRVMAKAVHCVNRVCYLVSLLQDIWSRKMYNLGQTWPHFAQFRAYSSLWSLQCVCMKFPDQG